MVEQRTENPCVACSIQALGTIIFLIEINARDERMISRARAERERPYLPTAAAAAAGTGPPSLLRDQQQRSEGALSDQLLNVRRADPAVMACIAGSNQLSEHAFEV